MTREAEIRAAIVAEAKSWIGTKYLPYARVKGAGVDCAQLPLAVYFELGIIPNLNPEYSQQWMHHRDEELYVAEILRFAREIEVEAAKPGDLIVWKFGRVFSHSAIVVDPPLVVHAAISGGAVYLADMNQDQDLKKTTRPRRAFSVFDSRGRLLERKVA